MANSLTPAKSTDGEQRVSGTEPTEPACPGAKRGRSREPPFSQASFKSITACTQSPAFLQKKTCATLGKSILSSRMASFFLIYRKMPIRKQNDPKDSSFTGREELLSVRNAHFPSMPHKLNPESSVGGTGERWSALWVCAHLYAEVRTHTHKLLEIHK